MRGRRGRAAWLRALLLASSPAAAVAGVGAQPPDDGFVAALGELRDAGFPDKEAIVERLIATGHPSARAGADRVARGPPLRPRSSDQRVVIVEVGRRRACRRSSSSIPLSLAGRGLERAGRPDQDRHQQPAAALPPHHAWRASRCRIRIRGAAGGGQRDAASLDETTIELLRQRAGVETDAAVRREIETGLALAALDGDGPARPPRRGRDAVASGSARKCATGWRRCSSEPPTAPSRRPTTRCARAAAAARAEHRLRPPPLRRHRDAVLRPEPRLGAGAGGDRPRHHVRRHGRHQHGARRADDARRLHDLRRAAGDAGPHRAVDPRRDSRGVSRGRAGGRDPRAHGHPLSLRAAARDAAGDLRRQPGPAAARALGVLGQQPRGGRRRPG